MVENNYIVIEEFIIFFRRCCLYISFICFFLWCKRYYLGKVGKNFLEYIFIIIIVCFLGYINMFIMKFREGLGVIY